MSYARVAQPPAPVRMVAVQPVAGAARPTADRRWLWIGLGAGALALGWWWLRNRYRPNEQLPKGFREKQMRSVQRAETKRQTEALKGAERQARKRQQTALQKARARCKQVEQRLKAEKRGAISTLREQYNAQIDEAKRRCQWRVARIRETGKSAREKAEAELRQHRELERTLRSIEKRSRKRPARLRKSTERRRESDDEVRANIPDELVPVFDAVKRDVRGTSRMSRSEAFMHWVEENPDEVVALQEDVAERDFSRLQRQEEEQYLQAVPF